MSRRANASSSEVEEDQADGLAALRAGQMGGERMLRTHILFIAIAVVSGAALAGKAAAYTVYVSNEKGNSITVIDSATLKVKQTIPVGQRPRGIMLTRDGKELLICASDDDTVQILDLATNEIV